MIKLLNNSYKNYQIDLLLVLYNNKYSTIRLCNLAKAWKTASI